MKIVLVSLFLALALSSLNTSCQNKAAATQNTSNLVPPPSPTPPTEEKNLPEPPPEPPESPKKTPLVYSNDKDAALFQAIEADDTNKIEQLIEQGANPNAARKSEVQYNELETPLYKAVSRRNAAAAEVLLRFGSDVNKGRFTLCESSRKCENYSPLQSAILGNDVATAEILIKYEAALEDSLIHSAQGEQTIAFLVKHGVDINNQMLNGDTHLMRSAFFGELETVKALLKYGADVHIRNKDGDSALFFAQNNRFKDKEIVNVIKEAMKKQESKKASFQR